MNAVLYLLRTHRMEIANNQRDEKVENEFYGIEVASEPNIHEKYKQTKDFSKSASNVSEQTGPAKPRRLMRERIYAAVSWAGSAISGLPRKVVWWLRSTFCFLAARDERRGDVLKTVKI